MEFESKAVRCRKRNFKQGGPGGSAWPCEAKSRASKCSERPNQEASGGDFRGVPVKGVLHPSQGPVP